MPTVSVEVEVDLQDLESDHMVEELELRGYFVAEEDPNLFDTEDCKLLLEILDKVPETVYTRRVRDKLLEARFK